MGEGRTKAGPDSWFPALRNSSGPTVGLDVSAAATVSGLRAAGVGVDVAGSNSPPDSTVTVGAGVDVSDKETPLGSVFRASVGVEVAVTESPLDSARTLTPEPTQSRPTVRITPAIIPDRIEPNFLMIPSRIKVFPLWSLLLK
jgi:hypothetical protein